MNAFRSTPSSSSAASLSSSDSPARVAVVMPLADVRGGAEIAFTHLIDHRAETGIEWAIVFFEDGPLADRYREAGLEVDVVHAGRLRNPVDVARCVRDLAVIFRTRRVDAVLSWMGKAHLYAGLAAWWTGRPAAWFQHAFPADTHWMDRVASAVPACGVLTCSRAGARQQSSLWPHRPTRVVHPGVDLDRFNPDRLPAQDVLRQQFELPVDAPIVGIVGRLQRWKGMHVFIDAVTRLRTKHPNLRGVVVGGKHDHEPEYPSRLRHQIERLRLEDAILMAGFQTDPAAWMKTFDVFIHASDREPFGLVVVEAMAMGLPVVASDTAGPTEIITEGEDGLFAPYDDDAALARQMDRYLTDPDWAAGVGRAARQRARDFAAPRFAAHTADALRSLVALPKAATGS